MTNSYYDETDWTEQDFSTPASKAAQSATAVETAKGVCPKCGKHVGKGLHFHVKACNETDYQTS